MLKGDFLQEFIISNAGTNSIKLKCMSTYARVRACVRAHACACMRVFTLEAVL